MTLPRTVRPRVYTQFPARVLAGTGMSIVKASGDYTIGVDAGLLTTAPLPINGATNQVLVYEPATGAHRRTPISEVLAVAHTHTAAQISDSTTTGRSLVTAADATAARTTLGLGNSATRNVGTTAGTVAAGDDGRLSDARAPLAHTHAAADVLPFAATGASTLRSLADRAADVLNVRDYSSITAAMSVSGTLYFPPGDHPVASNLTIPANRRVVLADGAYFTVSAGVTLTLRATIDANPRDHVFRGAGTVAGLCRATPHWFGAVANWDGTTGTDDGPAFNRMFAALDKSAVDLYGRPSVIVEILAGYYRISTAIDVISNWNAPVIIRGAGALIGGTRLYSDVSGPALTIRSGNDNSPAGAACANFVLEDIYIGRIGAAAQTGLQIGATAEQFIALTPNAVRRVMIEGFTRNLHQINARLLHYQDCALWSYASNTSNFVGEATSGGFCGDTTFSNCQMTYPAAPPAAYLSGTNNVHIVARVGSLGSRGWSLNTCDLYRGNNAIYLEAEANTNIGDVSINDVQLDGAVGNVQYCGVRISAASGALIDGIGIVQGYCAGYARWIETQGAGTVSGLQCNSVRVWYISSWPVNISAAINREFVFNQINFKQIGQNAAILACFIVGDCTMTGLSIAATGLWNPYATEKCDRLVYGTGGGAASYARWRVFACWGDWLIEELATVAGVTNLIVISQSGMINNSLPTSAPSGAGSFWRDTTNLRIV